MPNDNIHNMSVAKYTGNTAVGGSAYYPWPGQQWPQPWREPWPTRIYPTTTVIQQAPAEEYANEVEVERREFDAVLRFYRTRAKSKTLVKEITVPIGVLDWLTKDEVA